MVPKDKGFPTKDYRKVLRPAKTDRRSVKVNMKESVTVEDVKVAEKEIICYVQRQMFQEEMNMLQKGASNMKKGSSIYRLDPVMDEDGVLRVGGRLRRTTMQEEKKHPAILCPP